MLHISFYNDKGEPVQEYIPKDLHGIEVWLFDHYRKLLSKFNKNQYYWHFRYMFDAHSRKIEDIKFLKHYYERHLDDNDVDKIEKRHFYRAYRLYHEEFSVLLVPKWVKEKQYKGVSHPYAIAYHKNWTRDVNPQLSRIYHGINNYEVIEMLELMIAQDNTEIKKALRSIRYQNKLAKELNSRSKKNK